MEKEPLLDTMDIYMSEVRITSENKDVLISESIRPGSKSICHASVKVLSGQNGTTIKMAKVKLDSCGSVHSNLLNSIKPAQSYKLPSIRLRGIGGKTNMLKEIGILKIKRPDNEDCELLCYVFNEVVGQTEEMLLISLSAIIDAKINILYHMKESNKDACRNLKFWPNNKSFEEVCNDVSMEREMQEILNNHKGYHPRDMYLSSEEFDEVEKERHIVVMEQAYMTEIQLRRIVDRNAQEGVDQQSDGDERMKKDGENISKFSKEAMTLGEDVYANEGKATEVLQRVYSLYDYYVGKDRVFPTKNGAPRIMTKYKDTPYSYELQPEYAAGNKKFPCVKAMDWTGKTATA